MQGLNEREELCMHAQVGRSLIAHAEREAPRECCGLLAGGYGVIDEHFPLPNSAGEPGRRYFAEPRALVEAMRAIRESGKVLVGIYHSHPESAPEPSALDIEEAFYPECAYVIIGPAGTDRRLQAFRIAQGRAESLPISWVEE